MKPVPLTLIVAATTQNGIGASSSLPWRLPNEMAYFAKVTKQAPSGMQNAVIMGRKSWDGIPTKFRPLAGRANIVVSRQPDFDLSESPNAHLASSLPSALSHLTSTSLPTPLNRTFLIGGAQLYAHALASPTDEAYTVERVLLTRIHAPYQCDVFFPVLGPDWQQARHEDLVNWLGFDVPQGRQKEVDRNDKDKREVEYEFEMWVRKNSLA